MLGNRGCLGLVQFAYVKMQWTECLYAAHRREAEDGDEDDEEVEKEVKRPAREAGSGSVRRKGKPKLIF